MIGIVGLGVLGTRVVKLIDSDEELLLVDYDFVHPENVPRQYPAQALHKPKVEVCRDFFHPKAQIVHEHLDVTTVGVLSECSLVIDCTDNVLARRIINDFCHREGIPWIHGALSDDTGSVAVFLPDGPCFNCVYPDVVGETCSADLPVAIAEKTAHVMVSLMQQKEPAFVHITERIRAFEMEKRAGCKTCLGVYDWLHPRDFYITYCVNSECMAAKPHKHLHDHGHPTRKVVDGMPLELYPNGEIHFLAEAEDDDLYKIAKKVYSSR